MWSFFNDMKEVVRQTIVPKSTEVNGSQQAGSQFVTTPGIKEIGNRLSTFLSTINTAASTIIRNTLGDPSEDVNDDPPPPLLRLTDEQRSALPPDELFRGLSEAVSIIKTRSDMALAEARFLLCLSLEEQIAHTNDFLNCFNWWEQLVNKRLARCQDILMQYSRLPGCEGKPAIQQLDQRIQGIRSKCTREMDLIAFKGRLLREERYDSLNASSDWSKTDAEKATSMDEIEKTTEAQHQRDIGHFIKERTITAPSNKAIISTSEHEEKKHKLTNEEHEHIPTKEQQTCEIAEEEARKHAEEESRRQAEDEARRQAEEEARRQAEDEARRQAEEEARGQAEDEARRQAEEEACRQAEEEARKLADKSGRMIGVKWEGVSSFVQTDVALSSDLWFSLEHDENVARVIIVRAQQDDFLRIARDFLLSMRAVEEVVKNKTSCFGHDVRNDDDDWGDDNFDEEEVRFSKPSSVKIAAKPSKPVVLEKDDDDDKWSDW